MHQGVSHSLALSDGSDSCLDGLTLMDFDLGLLLNGRAFSKLVMSLTCKLKCVIASDLIQLVLVNRSSLNKVEIKSELLTCFERSSS